MYLEEDEEEDFSDYEDNVCKGNVGKPVGAARTNKCDWFLTWHRCSMDRNFTRDNVFTSHKLGQKPLKWKRRLWEQYSTISQLLATENSPVSFVFTANTSLMSYVPQNGKNVVIMGTLHRDGRTCGQECPKTEIIMDHNRGKIGVDNMDKLMTGCSCKRRMLCWPLGLLDISGMRCFAIWMALNPNWNRGKLQRRQHFLDELAKALRNHKYQEPQLLQPSWGGFGKRMMMPRLPDP